MAKVLTVETVIDGYVKFAKSASKFDANGKWAWARDLSNLLDAEADKKKRTSMSEEIGAKVGETLRGKPYSGSWVRQHAAAYKQFPDGLEGGYETEQAFLNAVNGNAGKSKTGKGDTPKTNKEAESDGTGASSSAATDYEARFVKLAKTCKQNGLTVERMHDLLNTL